MRFHVAALFRQRGLGSVRQWHLGLVFRRGLLVGIPLSVGMDAVPLWQLDLLPGRGLGMAAGQLMEWAEQCAGIDNDESPASQSSSSPRAFAASRSIHTCAGEPQTA